MVLTQIIIIFIWEIDSIKIFFEQIILWSFNDKNYLRIESGWGCGKIDLFFLVRI
jgi:hypothetical protein